MTSLAPIPMASPGIPLVAPAQKRLWLITFVDLVMLLLAFFVLLFSMSSVDSKSFATVARAYVDAFSPVGGTHETVVGPTRIPPTVRAPGDDLAYLEAILRSSFARDPNLSVIKLRLTGQYLVLEFPGTVADETGALDAETRRRVFDVGGVLSNLPNRIAIVAPADVAAGPRAWMTARAQAQSVQGALKAAGYPRAITVLAQGARDSDTGRVVAEMPLELIVLPDVAAEPTP